MPYNYMRDRFRGLGTRRGYAEGGVLQPRKYTPAPRDYPHGLGRDERGGEWDYGFQPSKIVPSIDPPVVDPVGTPNINSTGSAVDDGSLGGNPSGEAGGFSGDIGAGDVSGDVTTGLGNVGLGNIDGNFGVDWGGAAKGAATGVLAGVPFGFGGLTLGALIGAAAGGLYSSPAAVAANTAAEMAMAPTTEIPGGAATDGVPSTGISTTSDGYFSGTLVGLPGQDFASLDYSGIANATPGYNGYGEQISISDASAADADAAAAAAAAAAADAEGINAEDAAAAAGVPDADGGDTGNTGSIGYSGGGMDFGGFGGGSTGNTGNTDSDADPDPDPDFGGLYATGGETQVDQITQGAIAALMGNHPEPQKAIAAFIEVHGEKAFMELRARVMAGQSSDRRMSQGLGGEIGGPPTNKRDSIPGQITQAGHPVEQIGVEAGEYILPTATKEALNRNFGGQPGDTAALDQYVQQTNGVAPRRA